MRRLAVLPITAALLAVAAPARPDSLTVANYHANPAHSGSYVVPGLTWAVAANVHLTSGWTGIVKGPIYAQPLYWHQAGAPNGLIIVVTGQNVVQALDSVTGATVWQHTLGPVGQPIELPCKNTIVQGVIGTPVIDDAAGAIYVDSLEPNSKGKLEHSVHALSLADGSLRPEWPVNIQRVVAKQGVNFPAGNHAQRSALALVGNILYVPFGGASGGDCGSYHGWVVGVNVTSKALAGVWQTSGEWGGIWSRGGLAYDGTSLFVSTGNTTGTTTWKDGEAIIRLPLSLQHSTDTHDFFTPINWARLDRGDADLGGTGPLPISVPVSGGPPAAWVLALGKDGNGYVLDRANLGGIGGALLVQPLASDRIRTAAATYPASNGTFVAMKARGLDCPPPSDNVALTTIKVTALPGPAISTVWCASFAGTGSPMVTTSDGSSDPVVWMVGSEGDQQLHGFRGDTGQPLFTPGPQTLMSHTRRYVTPLAAEGRLYVATDQKVFAFSFGP